VEKFMTEQGNSGKPDNPLERLEEEARGLKSEAEKLEGKAEKLEEQAEKLEEKAERLEEEAEELEAKRPIEVVINDKYKITLIGEKQTGLSIKEAAIAQHVPIQLDFVLSIELGGGKTEIIGNDQHIKVKKGDRFLAIPDDDNS
jgi:predicted nuclease with TOPRIM domain